MFCWAVEAPLRLNRSPPKFWIVTPSLKWRRRSWSRRGRGRHIPTDPLQTLFIWVWFRRADLMLREENEWLMLFVCVIEWRAGMAGHLILSDQDLTSVAQGSWKRLNTLQHYKVFWGFEGLLGVKVFFFLFVFYKCLLRVQVPDGATVTLVSRQSKQIHHDSHDYIPGESESRFQP